MIKVEVTRDDGIVNFWDVHLGNTERRWTLKRLWTPTDSVQSNGFEKWWFSPIKRSWQLNNPRVRCYIHRNRNYVLTWVSDVDALPSVPTISLPHSQLLGPLVRTEIAQPVPVVDLPVISNWLRDQAMKQSIELPDYCLTGDGGLSDRALATPERKQELFEKALSGQASDFASQHIRSVNEWTNSCVGAGLNPKHEAVNHPDHYNANPSGVEAIDVIEHLSFNVGNAIKYLWRADHKGKQIEDLKKARWYVDREIQRLESLTDDNKSKKA